MSSLLTPGDRPSEQVSLGDVFRRLVKLEAVPAGGGGGGGTITEIISTDGSVTITDPTGPVVDLEVTLPITGIFFNTDPQSDDYLRIQTSSASPPSGTYGIILTNKYGMLIETENLAPTIPSLTVRTTVTTNTFGTETLEVFHTHTNTTASQQGRAVAATSSVTKGDSSGLFGIGSSGNSSTTVGGRRNRAVGVEGIGTTGSTGGADVYGLLGEAQQVNTTGEFGIGARGWAYSSPLVNTVAAIIGTGGSAVTGSDDTPYGVGAWGYARTIETNQDAGLGGWFAAEGLPDPFTVSVSVLPMPDAAQLANVQPVTGLLSWARSDTVDVAGLVIDVDSGSGTVWPIRIYVAGAEVFRIDPDGTCHNPAASGGFLSDL